MAEDDGREHKAQVEGLNTQRKSPIHHELGDRAGLRLEERGLERPHLSTKRWRGKGRDRCAETVRMVEKIPSSYGKGPI